MSKLVNFLYNSPMENFFGLLKQEIYYGVKYNSVETLTRKIDRYINWYNYDRIKIKLNELSPIEYRLQST